MLRALLVAALLSAVPAAAQSGPDAPQVGFGFQYYPTASGLALVTGVAPNGGAEAGGLRAGDLLIAVGDVRLDTVRSVFDVLTDARDLAPVPFQVERDGVVRTLSLGVAMYDPDVVRRLSSAFLCEAGDCVDGVGTWVSPQGERYTGTFVDGARTGSGTLRLTNGDLWVGDVRDGVLNGLGTYAWPSGAVYHGEAARGLPNGTGMWREDDGTLYTGEYLDGVRHGRGTVRWPDGTFWTGTWVQGKGTAGTTFDAEARPVRSGPFVAKP